MNFKSENMNTQSPYQVWIHLIKDGIVPMPTLLFRHYASLHISEEQIMLILHIYIFQNHENVDFPTINQLEERMAIDHHKIMILLQTLINNGLITIDEHTINGIRSEVYNLDPLLRKLFELATEGELSKGIKNEQVLKYNRDIFTSFEQEFGRPLSPLECESLTMWLDQDGLSEDLIIAALKEAVFAGKVSFRYIDRILFEWQRNNIAQLRTPKSTLHNFDCRLVIKMV